MLTNSSENHTEAEKRLVVALAVGIERRLRAILSGRLVADGAEPGYIFHLFTGDFEVGCAVLWELDVARAAYDDMTDVSYQQYMDQPHARNMYPPNYRLFDEVAIRDRLASGLPTSAPAIDDLIEAYLRLATEYGSEEYAYLPCPRNKPFRPVHPEHEEPLFRFVETGYAAQDGECFVWIDKIAASMIARYMWNEDDFDPTGLDIIALSRQADLIRESLSVLQDVDTIEKMKAYSTTWRALEIMRRWTGSEWVDRKPNLTYFAFDQAIAIAQFLEEDPL